MKRRLIAVLCIGLLLGVGSAQAARWVIPSGAHATGAENTNWRTDLRLVNPGDEAVTVTVYLLLTRQDNSALDNSVQFQVPAGGQLLVEDIFGRIDNYAPLTYSQL